MNTTAAYINTAPQIPTMNAVLEVTSRCTNSCIKSYFSYCIIAILVKYIQKNSKNWNNNNNNNNDRLTAFDPGQPG